MSPSELEAASSGASAIDKRRLKDGCDALRICTTYDFRNLGSPGELRARLRILCSGLNAMQSLDDLGELGNQIAMDALLELQGRREIYEAEIRRLGGK